MNRTPDGRSFSALLYRNMDGVAAKDQPLQFNKDEPYYWTMGKCLEVEDVLKMSSWTKNRKLCRFLTLRRNTNHLFKMMTTDVLMNRRWTDGWHLILYTDGIARIGHLRMGELDVGKCLDEEPKNIAPTNMTRTKKIALLTNMVG